MQTQLLCLITLACFFAIGEWSHYCNVNLSDGIIPTPSVQLYLQDQMAPESSVTIISSLQIKPPETNPQGIVSKLPVKVSPKTESQTPPIESIDNEKVEASLPEISRLTILHHFGADQHESWKGLPLRKLADKFLVKKEHQQNAGLFITLIKNGGTRACWGSINSTQRDLVKATVFTTEDALTKEYRYSKIKKSEINQLIPQVTVVKKIIPINSISNMKPLKQGLMVRAGGKGAVLLPGEASDPHYQLVKTKLKAGIPMSHPCQLYKIEADVYR